MACSLMQHLESSDYELGSALDTFKKTPILLPIQGFFITAFPLWELGYLLDESWLHEDAFDALMELMYFRYYGHSLLTPESPIHGSKFIILPSSFLSDTRRLYSLQPRRFSIKIENIRQRISESKIDIVAIPSIRDNHFVGYVYRPEQPTIEHADSLGGPPESDILPILQWVFSGVMSEPIQTIESIRILLQGHGNGGKGSCGFAALNFLERSIEPTVAIWNGSLSKLFRSSALEDLLLYHYISSCNSSSGLGSFSNWTSQVFAESSTVPQLMMEDWPCGYKDFNMYLPLVSYLCFKIFRLLAYSTI